ncbi:MAG TPA: hypothetical protein VMW43_01710 [Bacteroidota bacterium]|nr:hypothetical protein [Bacteroidota bacterium]
MIRQSCFSCGSAEFTLSTFRPRDFPADIFFIECARCHQPCGTVQLPTLIDSARSVDGESSRSARSLLSGLPTL